jgi:hypothetical protein
MSKISQSTKNQVPQRTVTEYLDNEYAAYGMYTIENRAIPSVIDGFKPTQRKIIYVANRVWRNGSEKPVKVFQLGGRIAADAHYHHGDCLDADTKILLSDGTYITIGDWFEKFPNEKLEVISYDEKLKKWNIGIGHTPRIGYITDEEFQIELESGEIIKCTGNHPFFTQRGWVNAEDLNENDEILNMDK